MAGDEERDVTQHDPSVPVDARGSVLLCSWIPAPEDLEAAKGYEHQDNLSCGDDIG